MKTDENGFAHLTPKSNISLGIQTLISSQQKINYSKNIPTKKVQKTIKSHKNQSILSGYDIAASTLMAKNRKQTLVGPFPGKSWQGRLWRVAYRKTPLTNHTILTTDQFSVESIAISVKVITRNLETDEKFTDECIQTFCKTKKDLESTLITIAKLIDSLIRILQTDGSKSYRVKVCALIRKPDGTFIDTGWAFPKLLDALGLAFKTDHESYYEIVKMR